MNNISWYGIRAFIHVVEHNSFTAAAEATGYSKANLSQQVTELEARLGVQLLYRTTRTLRLTELGEGYYHRCKKAVEALDAATEWVSQSMNELKGTIRLNAVGGLIGEEIIAPLAIEFQKQNPGVEILLDFSSVRVDLIEDKYDLVIRMGELPDSSLIMRKLHTITTRYVANPAFLSQYKTIKKPEHLKSLPLIRGSVDHWTLVKDKDQVTIQAEKGFKVISGRAMKQAALAGLGVTRLADIYTQKDIATGSLVEVLPNWSERTPLSMVCPPLRYQQAKVRALMDWLKDNFSTCYEKYQSN